MKHNWEYKKIKEVCKKESSNLQQNKIAGLSGDYPVYGAGGIVKNVTFYEQEKPYIGIVKDGAGVDVQTSTLPKHLYWELCNTFCQTPTLLSVICCIVYKD